MERREVSRVVDTSRPSQRRFLGNRAMFRSYRDRRLLLVPALAALALAGCAASPPRPSEVGVSEVYAVSRDELAVRLSSVLERHDIQRTAFDPERGVVRGERENLGETPWATCEHLHVHARDGERRRDAEPLRRRLELTARLEDVDGGTQVTLRPAFIQVSLNSFTNLEVTQRCRSTGTLEREILAGLRNGAA